MIHILLLLLACYASVALFAAIVCMLREADKECIILSIFMGIIWPLVLIVACLNLLEMFKKWRSE